MKEYKSLIPEITLKYKTGDVKKVKIRSSMDAYEVFMKFYDQDVFEYQESSIVLFLNQANNTIGWMKHTTGGIGFCVIDPKIIIGTALKAGATGIILSHNHPSGQKFPSREDENISKKVKQGCEFLGLMLLDHIIACEDGYYSFADEGKL
jgi:DNA repair protein RadC